MPERRAQSETTNFKPAAGEWSMLPVLIRDSGALRRIRKQGAALSVYMAIVLRTQWKNDAIAEMGADTIAEDTGLEKRQIGRAVRILEAEGLIEVVSVGRRNVGVSEYRPIVRARPVADKTDAAEAESESPPEINHSATSTAHSATSTAPDSTTSTAHNATSAVPQNDIHGSSVGHGSRIYKESQRQTTPEGGGAADGVVGESHKGGKATAEIEAALIAAGITRDKARELASSPHVTYLLVDCAREMGRGRRLSNPPGWLIRILSDPPPDLLEKVVKREESDAAAQKRKDASNQLAIDLAVVNDIPTELWNSVVKSACEQIEEKYSLACPKKRIEDAEEHRGTLEPLHIGFLAEAWRSLQAEEVCAA